MSDNSFNEDMDEDFESRRMISNRKVDKITKPKQITKPQKPLISYSKALPVKKIELAAQPMLQKSEAKLASSTLISHSGDNTPSNRP